MSKGVRVAVLGATGFTGEKLVEILLGHPRVEVTYLASQTPKPVAYKTMFPDFAGKTEAMCEPLYNTGKPGLTVACYQALYADNDG